MTFTFTPQEEKDFLDALQQVPLGRSSTQIEAFVLDLKGPPEARARRYRQCLLEMDGKYRALHGARISRARAELLIGRLEWWRNFAILPSWKRRIDVAIDESEFALKMQENLISDAIIELATFWHFMKTTGVITREEFEKAEPAYWQCRLIQQTELAILGTGQAGEGNMEALRQIGLNPYHVAADLKLITEGGMQNALASAPERMKIAAPQSPPPPHP